MALSNIDPGHDDDEVLLQQAKQKLELDESASWPDVYNVLVKMDIMNTERIRIARLFGSSEKIAWSELQIISGAVGHGPIGKFLYHRWKIAQQHKGS